jgi:site-specific recombinase XerD
MRHVFCQTLLDAGIDRLAVAHMLGHENTDMIDEVYGKDTTIRRRAAIPVLNNLGI